MTQQAAPQESIIRKIQNLLEMAKRAQGNENEAAVAMNLAQQLLARYNLDLQTVQGTQVAGGSVQIEEKREQNKTKYRAAYRWQRDLWNVLAETNYCATWIYQGSDHYAPSKNYPFGRTITGDRIVLLGRESNVKTVQMMGEYLIDTINRLLPYPPSENMSKSAHSWREGCVDRLAERIRAKYEAMQQDDSAHDSAGYTAPPGTALVVRSIVEAERVANYDARWGAGAWARKLARDVEWEDSYKKIKETEKKRQEAERLERERMLANETAAERAQREKCEAAEAAKQARASERAWRSWERTAARDATRLDRTAYHAGKQAADDISLHNQVGSGKKDKQLK